MTTTERTPTVVPADWVPGPPQGQWTYADYAATPDDGKFYEVVNGVLYMYPTPTPKHQTVKGAVLAYLHQFVQKARLGRVLMARTDVELTSRDIVQPDVFVLLNEHISRIGSDRVVDAPDLVVEVLSPSTMSHDLHRKFDAYERAQVPEYWVVNPGDQVVELFMLENGTYRSAEAFEGNDVLPTRIVPDWSVPMKQFFAFI